MIAANVGWYVFFDDINIIYPLTLIKKKGTIIVQVLNISYYHASKHKVQNPTALICFTNWG